MNVCVGVKPFTEGLHQEFQPFDILHYSLGWLIGHSVAKASSL